MQSLASPAHTPALLQILTSQAEQLTFPSQPTDFSVKDPLALESRGIKYAARTKRFNVQYITQALILEFYTTINADSLLEQPTAFFNVIKYQYSE